MSENNIHSNDGNKVLCSIQATHYRRIGLFGTLGILCLVIFWAVIPESRVSGGIDALQRLVVCAAIGVPWGGIGIFVLLYSYVWKIDLKESEFVYRNCLGITRHYKYSNVTVKELSSVCRYYCGKRHIVGVPYGYDNCEVLEKKVREAHKMIKSKQQ